jgi:hypothetical protein
MPSVRVALIVFAAIMVAFILTGIILTRFWLVSFIGLVGLFAYVVFALVTARRSD